MGAARDLPRLSTSRATSAATSAVSSSTRTSSSYTATVTPPSPSGNPNIFHSDSRPDGTVFIAVGSIVGVIIAALFLWWIITNVISRRIARKALYGGLESQSKGHGSSPLEYSYGDDKDMFLPLRGLPDAYEERASRSKSRLFVNGGGSDKSNLRDSTSWDSLPEFQPDAHDLNPVEKVNAIQDNVFNHYKRNSLFVSPVMEVLQQQQQQQTNRSRATESENDSKTCLSSSLTPPSGELNRPERAASPERKLKKTPGNDYHKRNGSTLGITPVDSSVSQSNIASSDSSTNKKNGHRKQVPSMYLEDMLEGNDKLNLQ